MTLSFTQFLINQPKKITRNGLFHYLKIHGADGETRTRTAFATTPSR